MLQGRTWYLSRLVVAMDLPLAPVAAHLADPVDSDDADDRRVGLALGVLGAVIKRGRGDAVDPLRRYVIDGRHWQLALSELWNVGGAGMCDGLADPLLARLDDAALHEAVDDRDGPWEAWSASQPRIRTAVDRRRIESASSDEWTVRDRRRALRIGTLGEAEPYVEEALDDCEPRARQAACRLARGPAMLARVRALRDDPLVDEYHGAAATLEWHPGDLPRD